MRRWMLIFACSIGLLLVAAARAQQSAFWVTGIVGPSGRILEGRAYGMQPESTLGMDANGDGDLADSILRVADPVTHVVTDLPFALAPAGSLGSMPYAAAADFQMALVRESAQGNVDLNGDGDKNDDVIEIRRVSTGVAKVVPLAIYNAQMKIASDGSCAVCVVNEQAQQADLNGDGHLWQVLVAIDPATGAWKVLANGTNAVNDLALAGGGIAWIDSEGNVAPPVDWNGDGDTNDAIVRVFETSTGITITIPISVNSVALHASPGDQRVYFLVYEQWQGQGGTDWNGDGDPGDYVSILYDRTTHALTSLGVFSWGSEDADAGHQLLITNEAANQKDTNGDGDTADVDYGVFDVASGHTTWLAIDHPSVYAENAHLGDGYVAFITVENQGPAPVDLNGDGDTVDHVPMIWNYVTGDVFAIPVAFNPIVAVFQCVGSRVFFIGDEIANHLTNYNFDDDVVDFGVFCFDVRTRKLSSIGRGAQISSSSFAEYPHHGAFSIHESSENNQSWNGDGDTADDVAGLLDLQDLSVFEPGMAITGPIVAAGSQRLLVVNEVAQGADVDGNGKLDPHVLALYTPSPGGCGTFATYGAGCATSAGKTPDFEAHGCTAPGGSVRLQVRHGIPGQSAYVAMGMQSAALQLPGECQLLATSLVPLLLGPYPLVSNGMFDGAALFTQNMPAMALPSDLFLQAFVSDPQSAKGFAATNGVEIVVP